MKNTRNCTSQIFIKYYTSIGTQQNLVHQKYSTCDFSKFAFKSEINELALNPTAADSRDPCVSRARASVTQKAGEQRGPAGVRRRHRNLDDPHDLVHTIG